MSDYFLRLAQSSGIPEKGERQETGSPATGRTEVTEAIAAPQAVEHDIALETEVVVGDVLDQSGPAIDAPMQSVDGTTRRLTIGKRAEEPDEAEERDPAPRIKVAHRPSPHMSQDRAIDPDEKRDTLALPARDASRWPDPVEEAEAEAPEVNESAEKRTAPALHLQPSRDSLRLERHRSATRAVSRQSAHESDSQPLEDLSQVVGSGAEEWVSKLVHAPVAAARPMNVVQTRGEALTALEKNDAQGFVGPAGNPHRASGSSQAARKGGDGWVDIRIGEITLHITQPVKSDPVPQPAAPVEMVGPEPVTGPADHGVGMGASLSRYYIRW